MNNARYQELLDRERNKLGFTDLEKEELDLLRKLDENLGKQHAEQADKQKKQLEEGAVAGDADALQKLEDQKVAEQEQKLRDQVDADIAKKQDQAEKDNALTEDPKDPKTTTLAA